MIEIPLKHGLLLADDQDAELVHAHHWHSAAGRRTFYALTNVPAGVRRQRTVRLHRLILAAGPGQQVDHKNGNGLDDRRANLRLATGSQNSANGAPPKNNTTGYRGVSFFRRDGNYTAKIRVNWRWRYLGYFPTAWEAAEAYNRAALEAWGEFAWQNVRQT